MILFGRNNHTAVSVNAGNAYRNDLLSIIILPLKEEISRCFPLTAHRQMCNISAKWICNYGRDGGRLEISINGSTKGLMLWCYLIHVKDDEYAACCWPTVCGSLSKPWKILLWKISFWRYSLWQDWFCNTDCARLTLQPWFWKQSLLKFLVVLVLTKNCSVAALRRHFGRLTL